SVMSHPHGKYLAVALAVLAALGAARPTQAQVTLRYKFKEGEKLRYLMTLTMKMKVDAGGKDVEANATMKMPMSMQTLKVFQDGKAEVLMKLEGMKITRQQRLRLSICYQITYVTTKGGCRVVGYFQESVLSARISLGGDNSALMTMLMALTPRP